jgi:hypothetical protein
MFFGVENDKSYLKKSFNACLQKRSINALVIVGLM